MIYQRKSEPLDLQALAEAACVTPEYLVRLFRREVGTTPIRFLWKERVRLGLYLLEHTGLPPSVFRNRVWHAAPPETDGELAAVAAPAEATKAAESAAAIA